MQSRLQPMGFGEMMRHVLSMSGIGALVVFAGAALGEVCEIIGLAGAFSRALNVSTVLGVLSGLYVKRSEIVEYLRRNWRGTKIRIFELDDGAHTHLSDSIPWARIKGVVLIVQLGGVFPKHESGSGGSFGVHFSDWQVVDASKGLHNITLRDAHGFHLERLYWTEALRIASTFRSVVELRAAAFAKDQLEKELEQATGELRLLEKTYNALRDYSIATLNKISEAVSGHGLGLVNQHEDTLRKLERCAVDGLVSEKVRQLNDRMQNAREDRLKLIGLANGLKGIISAAKYQKETMGRSKHAQALCQLAEETLINYGFDTGVSAKTAN